MAGLRELSVPLLRTDGEHNRRVRNTPADRSRDQVSSGKLKEEEDYDVEDARKKKKLASLMWLLTMPSPLDGRDPHHPDVFEFRQKNLQWRLGCADGAKGEVTDLVPWDSPGAGAFVRCASWPSVPVETRLPQRRLWMLSPDLESDLKRGFPQVWRWLQSQAGLALQLIMLLLVVCTYAACPLTVAWAKVVGTDQQQGLALPIKGRPFKEGSVIVVSWALIAVVGLLLSAATGGRRALRQCLDLDAVVRFAPAGVGWALADVCEVLAVARIDPATYGVISQARLLGAAAACRLIRGMRQTRLQWGVLLALSLVCMGYCLVHDGAVPNHDRLFRWHVAQAELMLNWYYEPVREVGGTKENCQSEFMAGVTLALMKVLLSVLSGVYGESCFKQKAGDAPPELQVQMTQISCSSFIAASVGYVTICKMQDEHPGEFFSGPDGTWTLRTVLVAVVYCWREWICNLCVKRFDSLVKNICNAVALVVTYAVTVITGEKPFCLLKALLLLAVVTEVVNYVATRRSETSSAADTKVDTNSDSAKTEPSPGRRAGTPTPAAKLQSQRSQDSFELKEL